jgi:hypothetical protein
MADYAIPKNGVAYIFYGCLVSQADTKLFKSAPTLAAGDFKVSTDGGAFANLATLPTNTPGTFSIKFSLSAGEMTGDNILVVASDAAGAEWCDQCWNIQTSARGVADLAFPATTGRSMVVDANGLVDANMVKAGPTGSGTAQTAKDIGGAVPAAAAGASGGLLISGSNSGTTTLAALTITGTTTHTGTTVHTGNVSMAAGLTVTQSTTNGAGISVTGNGSGAGMDLIGGNAVTTTPAGAGFKLTGGTASTGAGGVAGVALSALGGAGAASTNGAAVGVTLTGGGTNTVASAAHGFSVVGASTGAGLNASSGAGATGNGITATALSTNGSGMTLVKTGTGSDLNATVTPLTLAKTTNITGFNDIAATAVVSSGAITTSGGAVSTVTTLTNLPAITANWLTAAGIADGAIDRATFAADTGLQTIRSNTAQAGAATTITLDASASASNSFYNNTLLTITGGTGVGQSRFITAYVGATKVATVATWVTNPDATSTFAIQAFDAVAGATAPTVAQIATAVWQDGKSLYTSGVVPGGTNGLFIAGTNAATTVTTALTTTFTGNLTGSVGSVTGAVGSVTGAVGSVTAGVTLANGAHGGAAATMQLGGAGGLTSTVTGNLTGSVGSVTGAVGSVTGLTAANLDATISSRMASYTQPTGFLAATFPAGTVANTTNITAGTLTTVTTATNLTNAPTAGDLTATMKTSVQTAADAAVTANASVASILAPVTNTVVRGTSSATASTTSLTPSAFSPAGVAADQFKGRVLVFDNATTTTALRGQATTITASSGVALPVLTYTALTTAPVSGDTFSVL